MEECPLSRSVDNDHEETLEAVRWVLLESIYDIDACESLKTYIPNSAVNFLHYYYYFLTYIIEIK